LESDSIYVENRAEDHEVVEDDFVVFVPKSRSDRTGFQPNFWRFTRERKTELVSLKVDELKVIP